jgi:hypothetical protein
MTATVHETKVGFAELPTWCDSGLALLVGLLVLLLRFLGAFLNLIGEFGREAVVVTAGFTLDSADRIETAAALRGARRRAEYAQVAEDEDPMWSEPAPRQQSRFHSGEHRRDSGSRPRSETATSTDTLAGVAG